MKRIAAFFTALMASFLVWGTALAQDKVVYHIDHAEGQATKGLRNIRNHLDVTPATKIVVAHADGVDFLGARFEVCEITLRNRNLEKDQFSMDAECTPSGVARIGQLQQREKLAYIKP